MIRSPARSLRLAAGILLALAAALPAACGTATPPVPGPAHTAQFNQKLHDLLPQAVRDRGVLRVGTDASYAPMSAFGPDGRTIIGVEPDLGEQIGRVLGVRLQFRNYEFSTLLSDVARGNLDLAISAVTDTSARSRTADFVNYFRAGTSIVVQRGNPARVSGLNSLCGKVVAVQSGTTQVDLLARTQKSCGSRPITVKRFPSNSDALVQLRTGRAAAVLNDLPPAVLLVTDPRTRSDYQLASDQQYEPGPYGIVVAKGQPLLRDAIRGALEELRRNGVYDDVLARWHVQGGAVPEFTINSSR
jgi:polar amino acid transport system substrate-binding protein